MLPRYLRDKILTAYQPGQEQGKVRPTAEYFALTKLAKQSINEKETKGVIVETFREIAAKGQAECGKCGLVVQGASYGEILEQLGQHGERDHASAPEGER